MSVGAWNTTPTPEKGPVIALPSSSSSPPLAGIKPPIILSTVVLPQPLGPSSEISSPFRN